MTHKFLDWARFSQAVCGDEVSCKLGDTRWRGLVGWYKTGTSVEENEDESSYNQEPGDK